MTAVDQTLTDEERKQLEAALSKTEYRYFGDYPFSNDQREAVDTLTAFVYRVLAAAPPAVRPEQALLEMLGHIHPLQMEDFSKEAAYLRLRKAYCVQQPWPVPDQAAIVWRHDIMRMAHDLAHKQAFFDSRAAGTVAGQAATQPEVKG